MIYRGSSCQERMDRALSFEESGAASVLTIKCHCIIGARFAELVVKKGKAALKILRMIPTAVELLRLSLI